MIEGLFNQSGYVGAKKMLDLSALRHEAIASNLANLETPHYRRVDVDPNFSAQLQQAVASRDPQRIAALEPELVPDLNAVGHRKDGNTVELESELLKLNQNFMEHQMETQLITGALLKLRLAITGRGS
ncbi:MAG TPA: flagellar basal body rod protein FlgB [Verrucomicrobiae bacterium]|nr:flagellar basal body rod protein FlgB [Verrucomicrobiae bacterium]